MQFPEKSAALEYASKRMDTMPKARARAIAQLRKRRDIVITKPDKGNGAVVMDKSQYISLPRKSSVDDASKFKEVNDTRLKSKGLPPKYYHPLLLKEKEVNQVVKAIVPENLYERAKQSGSRLAHLYGLPKKTQR